MKKQIFCFIMFSVLSAIPSGNLNASETDTAICTYSTWVWNTRTKRSEGHKEVRKPHSELTPEEKDLNSNCTVCEEDQITIDLDGVPRFQVCKYYAEEIRKVIEKIKSSNFPVTSIIGYRVGKSKGEVDKNGLRNQFSHHSFGIAIDINAEKNGLYDNCYEYGNNCRLLRGGPWRPGQPGTITIDSDVYKAFKAIGWKWGGELVGQQKDFMHFSLTGE